jgi:hypothetical protein
MSKVMKQWTEKETYTNQTKTLWYLANVYFRAGMNYLSKFRNEDRKFLISEMDKLGYTNLNETSVNWYLGAVNGSVIKDRLKNSKKLQNDINTFRKNINLPPIKFGNIK